MAKKKKKNPRIITLIALLLVIMVAFGWRMSDFQLINAGEYASQGENISTRDATMKATRGEILDRYGRPIAVNREGYDVVFNGAYMTKSTMNSTIKRMTDLLSSYGYTWIDTLPMAKTSPYDFNSGSDSAISKLKSDLGLNHYATAQNCFSEMIKRYSLEGIDETTQRTIMGVRYSMENADFSISLPFTFAEDISSQLMTVIMESESDLPGVEIKVVSYREYVDDTLAVQLIGNVGKIQAEEWEKYKAAGYSYDDKVGNGGVEEAFENYLKGKDGTVSYKIDGSGNILSSTITTQPVNGDTVKLSIDKRLQLVAQSKLKEVVDSANSSGGTITGAAAVAVDVNTGQVLASANYPTYTLSEYKNNYEKLATDKGKPLFDRAFNGQYPPGSTFKPAIACAGLQYGKITAGEIIKCVQKYTYFEDYQPSCMHYHGPMNVVSAISKSCNYFFFETGRRLGIENMNSFCRQLGLGEYTGIEVPESKGILAGPDYSKSVGQTWYGGNTLQAAIGQSDNAFTPLQLAMYTATIANGGTRYKATLLNEVMNYTLDQSVFLNNGTVLNKLDISDANLDTVKEGMLSVAEEGTARTYFANYAIKVAGKTGTAQTTGADHSVFTVFAPYDNPQIAISVVVEHGQFSYTTGPVAKAMLDAYFFNSTDNYSEPLANTLLQ